MSCSVPSRTHVFTPLVVDVDWFTENCVGIHSVRVIAIEYEDPSKADYCDCIKSAEILCKPAVKWGKTEVEWGDPTNKNLFELFKVFAHGELGSEGSFGLLPFASSFDPD